MRKSNSIWMRSAEYLWNRRLWEKAAEDFIGKINTWEILTQELVKNNAVLSNAEVRQFVIYL